MFDLSTFPLIFIILSDLPKSTISPQLNDQTILFLTIQFNISHFLGHSLNVKQFYRTLSGANTLSQNGPGSNGNEGVFHIPQSSMTEASPSDSLVSYLGVG